MTGSKHLLDTGNHNVLVDCGLFQGGVRDRNWQALPLKSEAIESVVLTHAHLDHCGYLPRLVAQGFKGRIFCTPATADLARIVLADAGHIQEEDAERANRKRYSKHQPALPLFTQADAERAMTRLQPVGYNRPVPVAPGVMAEFINAGHLLGSSYARIHVQDSGKTLLFGGDLGRYSRPVLPDPSPVPEADVLLVESTYGDRVHGADDDGNHLAQIINTTVSRKGRVIIPAFALGRVEELLYWIDRLEEEKRIPVLPVYVDSPMASDVLVEYRKRIDELDPAIKDQADGPKGHPSAERRLCFFCTSKLRVISSISESKALQESTHPAIVISASGMATGGRVLHHLTRALPDPRNTILFVGYQAAGTRGRVILDGAKITRIHGQEIPINAHVESLDSMSAHADANEIMRWLGGFTRPPSLTCLVHGEPDAQEALKARIERELHWTVKIPAHLETIEI